MDSSASPLGLGGGGEMVTMTNGAAFGLGRSSARALRLRWPQLLGLRLGLMKKEPLGPRSGQRRRPGGSQWVWDEVAESRGIRSPQAFIVRLSHFLWLYCFCPTPYCLVSFCPSFQHRCLLFSSQPGCFHFFCLKFLRGRFYFQRFD